MAEQVDETRQQEIAARYKAAKEHGSKWREEARECYDFYSGKQWDEEDVQRLQQQLRPVITFNRAGILIDAVLGHENNNRTETRYIPRTLDDSKVAEELSQGADYFRDLCDAEFHESDAFRDMLISGMGWTNDKLSDDANPEYDLVRERVDPFEMYWDPSSRHPNLADARYLFRKKYLAKDEIRAIWPDWIETIGGETWLETHDDEPGEPNNTDKRASYHEGDSGLAPKRDILVLEYQWVEKQREYFVSSPSGVSRTLDQETFDKIKNVAEEQGYKHAKKGKTVFRRMFLIGGEVMQDDIVCPNGFTYHCITGKRDRNRGYWFGLMAALLDPQRWSNKWLSQTLHILNSGAKPGYDVELTAIKDMAKFERDATKPGAVNVFEDGALSMKRVAYRNPPPMPTGFEKLLEYANQSFTDTSGVNQELLGTVDRDQPGVLEYQRKQSAVTLLAPLFDSLRRYRKMAGRTWLYLMTHYMSDGRMIRITRDDEEKSVPFGAPPPPAGVPPEMAQEMQQMMQQQEPLTKNWKEEDVQQYDIIIDQASNSPNVKIETWSAIQPLLPILQEAGSPDLMMVVLEYSPLPESMLEKLKKLKKEAELKGPPPDPEMMKVQAEIQAEQQKAEIQAKAKQQEMQIKQQTAQIELQIMREKAAAELQIEREKAQLHREIELMKAQTQIEVQQHVGQVKVYQAQQDAAISAQSAEQDMELKQEQGEVALDQKKKMGNLQAQQAKQKAKQAASKPRASAN